MASVTKFPNVHSSFEQFHLLNVTSVLPILGFGIASIFSLHGCNSLLIDSSADNKSYVDKMNYLNKIEILYLEEE